GADRRRPRGRPHRGPGAPGRRGGAGAVDRGAPRRPGAARGARRRGARGGARAPHLGSARRRNHRTPAVDGAGGLVVSAPLRHPIAAARALKARAGRTVRRLRAATTLLLFGEAEFLRALGGRFGTLEEAIASFARPGSPLVPADLDDAA